MPVFGVGPIYVGVCLVLTIVGVILNRSGIIEVGNFTANKIIVGLISLLFIILGIYLWIGAVVVKKINLKIKEDKLITDGVFSIVRNPVYSAFLFIFTGIIIYERNIVLLILPIFYWGFMTILMKKTEEKWLKEKFKNEYEAYMKKVNRVIPWIKRK